MSTTMDARVGNDTLAMRVGVTSNQQWERDGRLKFTRTPTDVAVGLVGVFDKQVNKEGIEQPVAPYSGAAKVTRCKAAYLRSAFSAASTRPSAPIIKPVVPAAIVSVRLTPDEEKACGLVRDCGHKLRRFLVRSTSLSCLSADEAEIHIPISWDVLKQAAGGTVRVSQERATEVTGTTPVITRVLDSVLSDRTHTFVYPDDGVRLAHAFLELFVVACWPEGRVRVIESCSPLSVSSVPTGESAGTATPVAPAAATPTGDTGTAGTSPGPSSASTGNTGSPSRLIALNGSIQDTSAPAAATTQEAVIDIHVDAEQVGVVGFLPDRDSTATERELRKGVSVEFKTDAQKQYEVEKGLRDPCPVEGDKAYSAAQFAPMIKRVTAGLGSTLHNERLGVARHFAKETCLPPPSAKIRNTETLVMLAFMDELNAAYRQYLADPTTEHPVVNFPKKWGDVTTQVAEEGANFPRHFKMSGFVKTRELGLAPSKRPRLVATPGTTECAAHVPVIGVAEQLFKAVFGRWGFKGLDNAARDRKIAAVANRAYNERVVSADFSAMDSSWTFHEKFLLEKLLRESILAVLDAMPISHFIVDPATTLTEAEAETIRMELKELVLTLDFEGLILFSGERGTSLLNRLLVLVIYACELIMADGGEHLVPNENPEDLVARFGLADTTTAGGLQLAEWLREAQALRLSDKARTILSRFIEAGKTTTPDDVVASRPINVGDGDDVAMSCVWFTRRHCIERWALYGKTIVPKIARGAVEVLSRYVRTARGGKIFYALSKAGRNLDRTIASTVPAFVLKEGETGPTLPINVQAEYATMTLRRAAECRQMPFVRWFIFHAGCAYAERAIRGGMDKQIVSEDTLRLDPEMNVSLGTLTELKAEVRAEIDNAEASGNVMHEWLLFENGEDWVDVDVQGVPKWPNRRGKAKDAEAKRIGEMWERLDHAARERDFDPDQPLHDNAETYLRAIQMPAELAKEGMLDLLQGELSVPPTDTHGIAELTIPRAEVLRHPDASVGPQVVRGSSSAVPTVTPAFPTALRVKVDNKDLAMDKVCYEGVSTGLINGKLVGPWKDEDPWWRHAHVCAFPLRYDGDGVDPLIPCGTEYTHVHRGGHRAHQQLRGSCPNPKCSAHELSAMCKDGTRVISGRWCSESERQVFPAPDAQSRPDDKSRKTKRSKGTSDAQDERATTLPVAGEGKTVGEAAVPPKGQKGTGRGRGKGRGRGQ